MSLPGLTEAENEKSQKWIQFCFYLRYDEE